MGGGGGLSDLDFSPGLGIKRTIQSRFNSLVSFSPSLSSKEFFSGGFFWTFAIRLNNELVGLMIQSCIGGSSSDFKILHVFAMMFRFSVFSKDVGFLFHRFGSYECTSFSAFFSLWGSWEPNWQKNYDLWLKQKEDE